MHSDHKEPYINAFHTIIRFNFSISTRRFIGPLAALGRAAFFAIGFHVREVGHRVSSQEAPILIVAPHSTFFDTIIMFIAGLPSSVSRIENAEAPLLGSRSQRGSYFCGITLWPLWTMRADGLQALLATITHWPLGSLIARFLGPTWGPSGADRTQVGPMLAPWTLLSGICCCTFQVCDLCNFQTNFIGILSISCDIALG